MRGPLDVHRHLLAREVVHEMVHLPRTITTADELPDVLGLPAWRCLVTRVLCSVTGARRLAVVVAAGEEPAEEEWARLLGGGLRPARIAEIHEWTGYPAGLVCPIDLPAGIGVVLDTGPGSAIGDADVVYLPAGDGGTAVGLHLGDLIRVSGASPAIGNRRRDAPVVGLLRGSGDARLSGAPATVAS